MKTKDAKPAAIPKTARKRPHVHRGAIPLERRTPSEFSSDLDDRAALSVEESLNEQERRG
jgi:hypothetical protein